MVLLRSLALSDRSWSTAGCAVRDFLPWWAAVGGCRLLAWLGMDVKPPVQAVEGGKRSADPAWRKNPAFFAVRRGYLATSQLVSGLLAAGAGDPVGDPRARLAAGLLLDALAPAAPARPARRPGTRRPPGSAARGGRTGRRGPAPGQVNG
jgi:hypothetical protein